MLAYYLQFDRVTHACAMQYKTYSILNVNWRQRWQLMEQVWLGHHEIAMEMAMAVDVLLGCLRAQVYATEVQPMHALSPLF